ncbi:MAG: C40 family peptidase [Bilophila wadsworthia]
MQWAYRNVGVTLPRTARSNPSWPPHQVRLHDGGRHRRLQPSRRGYHTGIYLGGGSFIHSPGRGKSVSIAALSDPYFSSTFIGARRVQSKESDAEAIKSSWHWTPANPPAPTRPPLLRVKSAPLRENKRPQR